MDPILHAIVQRDIEHPHSPTETFPRRILASSYTAKAAPAFPKGKGGSVQAVLVHTKLSSFMPGPVSRVFQPRSNEAAPRYAEARRSKASKVVAINPEPPISIQLTRLVGNPHGRLQVGSAPWPAFPPEIRRPRMRIRRARGVPRAKVVVGRSFTPRDSSLDDFRENGPQG